MEIADYDELWNLGKQAYSVISDLYGSNPTNDELIDEYNVIDHVLTWSIRLLVSDGALLLYSPDSDKPLDPSEVFNGRDCTDKLLLAEDLRKSKAHFDEAYKLIKFPFRYANCICALIVVDQAIVASLGKLREEFAVCISTINQLLSNARIEHEISKRISVQNARAAKKRHQEHRELKVEALEYYKENKSRFRSRAAAAREISKKIVPITERTIDLWLKAYEEQQSAR